MVRHTICLDEPFFVLRPRTKQNVWIVNAVCLCGGLQVGVSRMSPDKWDGPRGGLPIPADSRAAASASCRTGRPPPPHVRRHVGRLHDAAAANDADEEAGAAGGAGGGGWGDPRGRRGIMANASTAAAAATAAPSRRRAGPNFAPLARTPPGMSAAAAPPSPSPSSSSSSSSSPSSSSPQPDAQPAAASAAPAPAAAEGADPAGRPASTARASRASGRGPSPPPAPASATRPDAPAATVRRPATPVETTRPSSWRSAARLRPGSPSAGAVATPVAADAAAAAAAAAADEAPPRALPKRVTPPPRRPPAAGDVAAAAVAASPPPPAGPVSPATADAGVAATNGPGVGGRCKTRSRAGARGARFPALAPSSAPPSAPPAGNDGDGASASARRSASTNPPASSADRRWPKRPAYAIASRTLSATVGTPAGGPLSSTAAAAAAAAAASGSTPSSATTAGRNWRAAATVAAADAMAASRSASAASPRPATASSTAAASRVCVSSVALRALRAGNEASVSARLVGAAGVAAAASAAADAASAGDDEERAATSAVRRGRLPRRWPPPKTGRRRAPPKTGRAARPAGAPSPPPPRVRVPARHPPPHRPRFGTRHTHRVHVDADNVHDAGAVARAVERRPPHIPIPVDEEQHGAVGAEGAAAPQRPRLLGGERAQRRVQGGGDARGGAARGGTEDWDAPAEGGDERRQAAHRLRHVGADGRLPRPRARRRRRGRRRNGGANVRVGHPQTVHALPQGEVVDGGDGQPPHRRRHGRAGGEGALQPRRGGVRPHDRHVCVQARLGHQLPAAPAGAAAAAGGRRDGGGGAGSAAAAAAAEVGDNGRHRRRRGRHETRARREPTSKTPMTPAARSALSVRPADVSARRVRPSVSSKHHGGGEPPPPLAKEEDAVAAGGEGVTALSSAARWAVDTASVAAVAAAAAVVGCHADMATATGPDLRGRTTNRGVTAARPWIPLLGRHESPDPGAPPTCGQQALCTTRTALAPTAPSRPPPTYGNCHSPPNTAQDLTRERSILRQQILNVATHVQAAGQQPSSNAVMASQQVPPPAHGGRSTAVKPLFPTSKLTAIRDAASAAAGVGAPRRRAGTTAAARLPARPPPLVIVVVVVLPIVTIVGRTDKRRAPRHGDDVHEEGAEARACRRHGAAAVDAHGGNGSNGVGRVSTVLLVVGWHAARGVKVGDDGRFEIVAPRRVLDGSKERRRVFSGAAELGAGRAPRHAPPIAAIVGHEAAALGSAAGEGVDARGLRREGRPASVSVVPDGELVEGPPTDRSGGGGGGEEGHSDRGSRDRHNAQGAHPVSPLEQHAETCGYATGPGGGDTESTLTRQPHSTGIPESAMLDTMILLRNSERLQKGKPPPRHIEVLHELSLTAALPRRSKATADGRPRDAPAGAEADGRLHLRPQIRVVGEDVQRRAARDEVVEERLHPRQERIRGAEVGRKGGGVDGAAVGKEAGVGFVRANRPALPVDPRGGVFGGEEVGLRRKTKVRVHVDKEGVDDERVHDVEEEQGGGGGGGGGTHGGGEAAVDADAPLGKGGGGGIAALRGEVLRPPPTPLPPSVGSDAARRRVDGGGPSGRRRPARRPPPPTEGQKAVNRAGQRMARVESGQGTGNEWKGWSAARDDCAATG
ncbi:LOW QUALITY PROTEIN: hypothetical protein BU14_0075s0014 [Porphyra umbilicalis]|uniref:Uncharacterized protein n=1 Tax=Porphyra umbilicalis TaxID=2786 RepID=A0A1X6PF91_PORUM|nr:LOW QUALITY PROTEIN: hypothetical protein BU14_0075s0014 [Porphyra umbilicalis]|eukprot:OSX79524.1 LOW QUALITY PROTEIN: hypothetical protein BU14_0075s0014 [Porphyra umbilicalis]